MTSSKTLKSALVLVILIGLLSVSAQPAHAADGWWSTITNSVRNRVERLYLTFIPGDKNGKSVVRQAFQATQQLKSADLKTAITVDLQSGGKSLTNIHATIAGPIQMGQTFDPETYKQDLHLAGEATMQGVQLRGNADLKLTGKVMYFKFNELPPLPGFATETIQGKWLRMDNVAKQNVQTDAVDPVRAQKFQDAFNKLLEGVQYSPAHKETKDGHKVYVTEAIVPNAAIRTFSQDMMEIQKSSIPPQQITAESEASMEKALDQIGDVKVVLWIDQDSFFVRHIEIPLDITVEPTADGAADSAPNLMSNPSAALAQLDHVSGSIVMDFDKFNEPISFEEPQDAIDAMDAFSQVMMGAMTQSATGSATTKTGTSELPTLTPAQKLQLEQLKKSNPGLDIPTFPGQGGL